MKIFFLMIFLHIVDDYVLQGKLGLLIQKSWWVENTRNIPNPDKYRYDYIIGLVMHSLSWSFMICLPLFFTATETGYVLSLLVNAFIHGIIDDLKANRFKINLITDQSLHILQIAITWYIFFKL